MSPQLLQDNFFYRQLVSGVKDMAILLLDTEGRITHWNAGAEAMLGYTDSEAVNRHFAFLFSAKSQRAGQPEAMLERARRAAADHGPARQQHKDGTTLRVRCSLIALRDERNVLAGFGFFLHCAPRRQKEAELHRINESLEQIVQGRTLELTQSLEREKELNNMKSQFVSIASHEFRTPLSTILSSVELIEFYGKPEQWAKREKHLARIKAAVFDLTNILDDFLSLDRLEHGKVQIQPLLFDLHQFLLELIDDLGVFTYKKNQQIRLSYEGATSIWQDRKILRIILLNLLSNALKYSPEAGQVWIRASVDDGGFRITVKDEGIGIPAGSHDLLFGMFYRAANAAHIQGSGLGLNIVKRYVDLLQGQLWFSSVENRGSEFSVQLPQRPPA